MSSIIGTLQSLSGHMSVDLRCGETGVTEEGLHAAQVGSVIEEMSGKGVAKFVWAECRGEAGFPDIVLKHQPDRAGSEALATLVQKEGS